MKASGMKLVVGVDASRNRSGGARVHLTGLLEGADPTDFGIDRVHVWAYKELLRALPDSEWLVKHNPPQLQKSLLRQLWWQRTALPREARSLGCNILLNTDAGTVCRFRPSVVMSRDMLSYEPGEMQRYAYSRSWLRLLALRYVQASSLRNADGAVFLTRYAARVIQQVTGPLHRVATIPHGVSEAFRRPPEVVVGAPSDRPIRCLYVSPIDLYKHQWVVVHAFAELRRRGYDVTLTLAGNSDGPAAKLLDREIQASDPAGEFVRQLGFIDPADLPSVYAAADIFVFASSCENMPNTLVEAMASGLPIACARRGPMPEVLQDGGVYFDPEDPSSIVTALETLLRDPARRRDLARRSSELARQFSWKRCAEETWSFVADTAGLPVSANHVPAQQLG